MNWPWRKKASVPKYINAVHLMDAIHNELASTDDPEVEAVLYRLLEHVGQMKWCS